MWFRIALTVSERVRNIACMLGTDYRKIAAGVPHRRVIYTGPIDEYFDFYVEAQGALHKSRPDVFFQTLTRLGGTDPDRCVVCEDSLYAARTAHDAGFHVIGIADAASKSDEPALREVSDQFLTDWTELDWDKV